MLTLEYQGRKISILISSKTIERILDAIYPDKHLQGVAKGYIELVNFFYVEFNIPQEGEFRK